MNQQRDETKAVQTVTPKTPVEMIALAVNSGADLDKIEKLLTLQERWEANEAKKAYNLAMSQFKSNPPKIKKDKKVGYTSLKGGTVGYAHASLANVTEKINAELSKHGLSASWTTKQNGQILVTCRITHKLGHSEETTLSAPSDTSGQKNAIQSIGSTVTYLSRYTLLALTGLATHDQDDDGKAADPVILISDKDVNQITDLVDNSKVERASERFLKYMNVDKIEDIPRTDLKKALVSLRAA